MMGMPPPTDAFEGEIDAALDRELDELVARAGEEHLVGGDHALPWRRWRARCSAYGRLFAAHDLDHHVDLGIVQDLVGVGGEERAIAFGNAILVDDRGRGRLRTDERSAHARARGARRWPRGAG